MFSGDSESLVWGLDGLSVVGGTVLSVSRPLRRIAAPVVAAGPSGKRFRTRLHLSPTEAAALAEIGELLGSLYRRELAGRIRLGRADRKAQSVWRAERKRALTAVSSSRWAGALTRAVEDQYQLGMRALGAHVGDLQSAIGGSPLDTISVGIRVPGPTIDTPERPPRGGPAGGGHRVTASTRGDQQRGGSRSLSRTDHRDPRGRRDRVDRHFRLGLQLVRNRRVAVVDPDRSLDPSACHENSTVPSSRL